jgi:hypothetical protein
MSRGELPKNIMIMHPEDKKVKLYELGMSALTNIMKHGFSARYVYWPLKRALRWQKYLISF